MKRYLAMQPPQRMLFATVLISSLMAYQDINWASTLLAKATSSKANSSLVAQNKPSFPTSSFQACNIFAYVIDKDPQGVNVRSGPGVNYKIIGKLPTTTDEASAELVASQRGWVQLGKVESEPNIQLQGNGGWVAASLLGTSTRGYETKSVNIYANATTQSRAVGRIPARTDLKLLGCNGSWAKVEYKGIVGWLAREEQCATRLTTCS
ncbi:MAG: SH3 domain-containing protein [Aphanothece sp. CMT-3BRIN-NPC111]|jgi:SH3-like domain-containing protein|nr:SH3 domain-containing protein [Aphanothece sp. CMT-3BRIN-NPC111]